MDDESLIHAGGVPVCADVMEPAFAVPVCFSLEAADTIPGVAPDAEAEYDGNGVPRDGNGAPHDALALLHSVPVPRRGGPSPSQVIEALLFSADTPLSASRLAELIGGCSPVQLRLHIAELNDKYVANGLSFRIVGIARGYQMMTLAEYQPWITRLHQQRQQTRLSAAALETLAIIAYKQPVIRADVEAIRGVACGEVLARLREMGLVKVVGRAEVVGRPLLYGTTKKFLDTFGLADLDDLPPLEALTQRRAPATASEPAPVKTTSAAGEPVAVSA